MTIHVFNPKFAPANQERRVRSISDLSRGDLLCVGYRDWVPTTNDEFLGFVIKGESYRYADMKELRFTRSTVGFDMNDVRAVFKSDGAEWEAYRYKGHWAVGSSADNARLHSPILILSGGPLRPLGAEG